MASTTNHFRTRLMNLTYASGSATTDLIDSSFSSTSLAGNLGSIHGMLFPTSLTSPSDRTAIVQYCNAYTILVNSFGLADIFTQFSPTITYTLSDLYNFEYGSVNLVQVANYTINSPLVDTLLSDQLNLKYDEVYRLAIPRMKRLAGLVAAYSYRLG